MSQIDTGKVWDEGLVESGKTRIEWADDQMKVLADIRKEWEGTRPLAGLSVAACLHVTTETANLMRTLVAGGASVALAASNPLSTQDDVAAALNHIYGVPTCAGRGEGAAEYYANIEKVLSIRPSVVLDDGADLINTLHGARVELLPGVVGGAEETTTGVNRLKAMASSGMLRIPVVAVNDADTKHLFDNRYGTGQSTIDGILRATNYLLAGTPFVVAGYGWCGRGVASRARGMGAQVIVTEVNPTRALEALMDGFSVMPMREAAKIGRIFVTATGGLHAIDRTTIASLGDGAILANTGHFNVEIDTEALEEMSTAKRPARENVVEYLMADGRRIRLLAEGRLVNLSAAEGHPASVMDMSFANQALVVLWLSQNPGLEPGVHDVPKSIDEEVARRKLLSMGVHIDTLTDAQRAYLAGFSKGT